jgi:hypothetical protein
MGSGEFPQKARDLRKFVKDFAVAEWAGLLPGGSEIDFGNLDRALAWIGENTACPGCKDGGGPPDCWIRKCARERGLDDCVKCPDLEPCEKFDWLGPTIKEALLRRRGG